MAPRSASLRAGGSRGRVPAPGRVQGEQSAASSSMSGRTPHLGIRSRRCVGRLRALLDRPYTPDDSPLVPVPLTPSRRLLLVTSCSVASVLAAVAGATRGPWLGLALAPGDDSTLVVAAADSRGPARDAPVGWVLDSIGVGAAGIAPRALDRLDEPDFLDTWGEARTFYARQGALYDALRAPEVEAVLRAPDGTRRTLRLVPAVRPLGALPAAFWFQLFVGVAAALIGAWVWTLRPDDWATRAFALSGASVLLFTHAAAVYSARELALPSVPFRVLAALNHLGATAFGATLCALFVVHPRRLVGARALAALATVTLAWWVGDTARLVPDQDWASRFPNMLEMVAALALAVVQWRRASGDPRARAVLRWFGASVLLGPGLFIGMIAASSAVGAEPPIPQAYAFGFFLLTYAGLALGLRRYRLFDLDEWALRLLFWGAVATAFLLLDLSLLNVVGDGSARALLVVVLLGLTTLPVRQWVWAHLLRRPVVSPEQVAEQSLAVAYARTDGERAERWRAQLRTLFDPLAVVELDAGDAPAAVVLGDQGASLAVPPVASSPALRLTHAGGGRRLFRPADVRLASRLVALLRTADASRAAFETGVRAERARIARDLHDHVSSPLMAGLAQAGGEADDTARAAAGAPAVAQEIRRAIGAMREVVRGERTPAPLADVLADARFAEVERLVAAGLSVDWPVVAIEAYDVSGEAREALTAFVREATSNILRHAKARRVEVRVEWGGAGLALRIADDGRGIPDGAFPVNDGLPNLHARAAALGGRAEVRRRADGQGTEVILVGALRAARAGAA